MKITILLVNSEAVILITEWNRIGIFQKNFFLSLLYISLSLVFTSIALSVLVLLFTGRIETESIPQFLSHLFGFS